MKVTKYTVCRTNSDGVSKSFGTFVNKGKALKFKEALAESGFRGLEIKEHFDEPHCITCDKTLDETTPFVVGEDLDEAFCMDCVTPVMITIYQSLDGLIIEDSENFKEYANLMDYVNKGGL